MKDSLGGYPCDIIKEGGKITIRFHPGKNNGKEVKHPNSIKFSLALSDEDVKKLRKILS